MLRAIYPEWWQGRRFDGPRVDLGLRRSLVRLCATPCNGSCVGRARCARHGCYSEGCDTRTRPCSRHSGLT